MGMHRIFSCTANMSIYVVVFNLEWLLGMHTCDSRCNQDCECNPKDTFSFIDFWFNLIARNADRAPVLVIGTHKDTVVSGDDLTKSNVDLATSNEAIIKANKIFGEYVASMKVYKEKMLNLHLPEQSSSFCALCV